MADSDIVKMVKERIEFSTDERKFNILVVPADAERHYGERRYCSLIRKQTFHHFARLPAELRVMIWRYAVYLQDRVVEFAKIPGQKIGDKDTMKILCAPVPPLFLVNWESYLEAKRFYVWFGPIIKGSSKPNHTGPPISFEDDIFFYKDDIIASPCIKFRSRPRRIAGFGVRGKNRFRSISFKSHPLYSDNLPEAIFKELEPPGYQNLIIWMLSHSNW